MFGWVIRKSSNKGKTPKSFAYLLEFFNTQINVCLGEQLIIMMDVGVPQTKILTIALMCSLHSFYLKNVSDSLNRYLAATVSYCFKMHCKFGFWIYWAHWAKPLLLVISSNYCIAPVL